MTTKDKILQEALAQLNERGLPEVSIRSISNKLNMSSGNLTYHFKNIDIIVYELYLGLVVEMNVYLGKVEQNEIALESMLEDTDKIFRLLWKYRFLLLDFIAINRRIPKMNAHFRDLIVIRRLQFKQQIERLVENEIFIPEPFPGTYDILIGQLIVFYNAWIPDAALLFDGEEEKIIPYYIGLFKGHMFPYFTSTIKKQLLND